MGSFVTKVESNTNSNNSNNRDGENNDNNHNQNEIKLRMTSRQTLTPEHMRISNTTDSTQSIENQNTSLGTGNKSAFHVFERQGYDSVMKTITGDEDDVIFARKACELLQVFEKLMPAT